MTHTLKLVLYSGFLNLRVPYKGDRQVDDEERREAWALFRYNVIAPLLENGLDVAEKAAARKEILTGVHITPEGKKWTISERTLRNWLARHRTSQLKGLKNQRHENIGAMKAVKRFWSKLKGCGSECGRAAFRTFSCI